MLKVKAKKKGFTDKVVKNTLFNSVGKFFSIFVTFITTPYIIAVLGKELFGVWAVFGVLTQYFNLLDFGIRPSFVKYVSHYNTKKQYIKINQIVNTGLVFYLVMGVILVGIVFLVSHWLINFFNVPLEYSADALFVIRLGVILFASGNLLSVFSGVMLGLQRMEYQNTIGVINGALRMIAIFSVLSLGFGIRGLIISNAVILVIAFFLNFYFAKRIFPKLSFNLLKFRFSTFKQLLGFGVNVQVSQAASLVNFQLDRILIPHYVGIAAVSFYDLGIKISRTVRDFPLLIRSALMPAVAELYAQKKFDKIYNVFLKVSRYSLLVGMPVAFFIFFNAKLIMLAWVGSGFDEAAIILQIIVWGYFINMMGGGITSIVQGIGKPKYQMRAALISFILNLVLSIVFVIKFGFYGAAVGTVIAMVFSGIYYQISFQRLMKRSFFSFLKQVYLKPLIFSLALSVLLWGLNHFVITGAINANRWFALSVILGEFILFVLLFTIMIVKFNYLKKEDAEIFSKIPLLGRFYLKLVAPFIK